MKASPSTPSIRWHIEYSVGVEFDSIFKCSDPKAKLNFCSTKIRPTLTCNYPNASQCKCVVQCHMAWTVDSRTFFPPYCVLKINPDRSFPARDIISGRDAVLWEVRQHKCHFRWWYPCSTLFSLPYIAWSRPSVADVFVKFSIVDI